MTNLKYIDKALSNKENGISPNHELYEFIRKTELKFNTKILEAVKINRPIHKDVLIKIITEKHSDCQPFRSNNNYENTLRAIYKDCYNDDSCSTDYTSLEDIILLKLEKKLIDFISEKYLPIWSLQRINNTFIFFLWYQDDANRMKKVINEIGNDVNNYFWSMKNYDCISKFRIKIEVDSKENLDSNYNGSFREYFD